MEWRSTKYGAEKGKGRRWQEVEGPAEQLRVVAEPGRTGGRTRLEAGNAARQRTSAPGRGMQAVADGGCGVQRHVRSCELRAASEPSQH